jgi:acetylornithine deacetylase/succinyl-diaminopimelate desuccinylase-like protein
MDRSCSRIATSLRGQKVLHPSFSKAAAYITAEDVRGVLMDLINIPSPTGQERSIAHYLIDRMRAVGLDTDLQFVDCDRPNAVGHLYGQGNGYNLLFTGHMDTSYSGEEAYLIGEGFKPKAIYRDGWVWGLGANNMKSGLAAALVTIEAIAKAGIMVAGDISFGAVVGEIEKIEIEEFQGSEYSGYGVGSRHLVTHGVTADFALLAEPTGLRIAIANMGCIWLRITVGGTVAHSALSNRPDVVNAINLMHDLQNDIITWTRDYAATHAYMGEAANVTVAAIRGGAPWRLSRNPHECSLYLDIRTVPNQTTDQVKRTLKRILRGFAQRTGAPEPRLHVYVSDPPVSLDRSLPVIEALGSAQVAISGSKADPIIRRPGADAVHLTAYGVPCVAFGPGGRLHPDVGSGSMHAVGEHVFVDDCVTAAKIYLATALDLCNREAPEQRMTSL